VDREGLEGEQIYVFAEIRDGESLLDESLHQIATEIVANIYDHMGFRPARTYLLKPHGIPLTDNGKIQHTRLKKMYSGGKMKAAGSILYPEL
jgi:acyl-coenzyme A synthetase/AMP-(fatty) acid ligase